MTPRSYITGVPDEAEPQGGKANFTPGELAEFRRQLSNVAAGLGELAVRLLGGMLAPSAIRQSIDNPNAFALAALNYGDVGAWRTITQASVMQYPVTDALHATVIIPPNPLRGI